MKRVRIPTGLQEKVRNGFCALVKYGFKAKELNDLGGYENITYVKIKVEKCKS